MSTVRQVNNLKGKGFDIHGVPLGTKSMYNTIGYARPKWPELLMVDFRPKFAFTCFRRLPLRLQNLVWEETFSQLRIFDNITLRILNPQDGMMYSYLTPYALYVCRDSRAFAQNRLVRTFLFREWPQGWGRPIYFNTIRDTCVYRFTNLAWGRDFIPGQCLFSYVEIRGNGSPDALTDTQGYGLRSKLFFKKFPNLKSLLVRERDINLNGIVLINGWTEDDWNKEAKLKNGKQTGA